MCPALKDSQNNEKKDNGWISTFENIGDVQNCKEYFSRKD